MTTAKAPWADFKRFTLLRLNERGEYLDDAADGSSTPVADDALVDFFRRKIALREGVTDVFVWVHGWQNDEQSAGESARKMFHGLEQWIADHPGKYPRMGTFVPAFFAVHWPSKSWPTPGGYKKMRDRAREMTTKGTAEFLLAALLGYLNAGNRRSSEGGRKVLRARGGFYVHCIGHSFGGRFLTAAIKAAATPTERSRKVLAAVKRPTKHPFTVDSLCVLQMAVPATAFQDEFKVLLDAAPLSGPIVLTHSSHDTALCRWHMEMEKQPGVGCVGASQPGDRIGSISLHKTGDPYAADAFGKDITNVDASCVFKNKKLVVGAHSDIWHPETFHLLASVVEQTR